MSVLYSVWCNGRGPDGLPCTTACPPASATSLRYARINAKERGWTHPRRGEDYCKRCSEARAKRAKEENPNGYY